MKIKVYCRNGVDMPKIISKGDWIDLVASKDYTLSAPCINVDNELQTAPTMIDLGVAMELPSGCEAYLLPRSSTFKKKGILLANSMGIIDNTYCSMEDIWKAAVLPMKAAKIKKNEPLFQFRIMLSQKATIWDKIKWLFSNKIEIEKVDVLYGKERGGFGSTDKDNN